MEANAAGPQGTFGRRMLIYVAFVFGMVVVGFLAYRTGYSRGVAAGTATVGEPPAAEMPQVSPPDSVPTPQ